MIFTFKNKTTEEYFEKEFRNGEEKEAFLKGNPDVIQTLQKLRMASPYSLGRRKTDSDFRNVMKHMNKTNPGGNITTHNLSEI